MAGFQDIDKELFPINSINSVVKLFNNQLTGPNEPDLALLSIVTGLVENHLTSRSFNSQVAETPENSLIRFELETVENLYERFHLIITGSIDSNTGCAYATRELVKKVSDLIWNTLTRSYYKDRAHLQSLYSYLTGSKLDCFGVAFAVVAACQVLKYNDVHLALSEDHAWVVFGPNGSENAEVTWHGKGNEDKRGQEVGKGVSSRSWIYVNNKPVVCTRQMEVAALVSAINPSLNNNIDAIEVSMLQQQLLWLLYDLGHLDKYPTALGHLGDLEGITPMRPEISCRSLFDKAIRAARKYYANQHVYPYTYQGGYFFRNKKYLEAFESWANASDVIRQYNYSRDDGEIYKEFLDITVDLMPQIMKIESSGFEANTILRKPECYINLLRFYDGICQWEEGSGTPVLHIGWATPFSTTLSKFDYDIRAQVNIVCDNFEDRLAQNNGSYYNNYNNNNNNNYENRTSTETQNNVREQSSCHPTIEALTAACSEKLLNPDYLLQGDGSPFVGKQLVTKFKNENEEDPLVSHNVSSVKQGGEYALPNMSKHEDNGKENGVAPSTSKLVTDDLTMKEDESLTKTKRLTVTLRSQKMKTLRELLLAEKLNTQAISLLLTAQSQVLISSRRSRNDNETVTSSTRPKRSRRE